MSPAAIEQNYFEISKTIIGEIKPPDCNLLFFYEINSAREMAWHGVVLDKGSFYDEQVKTAFIDVRKGLKC